MYLDLTPGKKYMGRFAKGADLLHALEDFCRVRDITLAEIQAIGAVKQARVGYYEQREQKYHYLELNQPLEIVSLLGNVSLKDGKPMVHAHITLADESGRAYGGHLAEGTIIFACEYWVQEYRGESSLVRQMNKPTGLFLWPEP